MKRLMIKSTVYVGFQLAILSACASENLQTTGLEPNPTVAPGQPNTPAVTPSQTPTTPAMEAPTNEGSNGEGNPAAMLPTTGLNPPATDPNAPAAMPGGNMEPETETEEPPPETEVVLTPSQIGGQLEGFLHLAPCESQDFGHDCTLPQCVGGSKTLERTLQLGGEVGTIYDLTIHVYGVVEPRVYQGGVRRAGENFNVNGLDFWHVGGTVPANPGTYNSYEMHINPPVVGEVANTYFLNSRTGGDQTWVIRLDYEATFAVPGGGTIRWRSFDLNCRQITNCDDNECGPLTPKPVAVASVQGANPPPPATFVQPYNTGANVGRGQWVYIDVINAVARP